MSSRIAGEKMRTRPGEELEEDQLKKISHGGCSEFSEGDREEKDFGQVLM